MPYFSGLLTSRGLAKFSGDFQHQNIDIKPIFTTDTVVRDNILENLLQDFEIQKAFIFNVAKCGIFGNWRRIAHFDTSIGDLCPSGLRTVANATTNQTACGRTVDNECTSLSFTSG